MDQRRDPQGQARSPLFIPRHLRRSHLLVDLACHLPAFQTLPSFRVEIE